MALKDEPCTCCGKPSKRRVNGRPYCNRHGQQMLKHGRIKYEEEVRQYGSHEIFKNEEEGYYYMIIQDKICKFDEEDIELAKSVRWCLQKGRLTYYVREPKLTEQLYGRTTFHRIIMGFPTEYDVDHINGDGLDNRRCNLRLVPHGENIHNVPVMKHNKCGHKNIHEIEKDRKYEIRIQINGKRYRRVAHSLEEALEIREEMYKKYDYKCFRRIDREDD